jgi:Domain of unknown function (DUF932)
MDKINVGGDFPLGQRLPWRWSNKSVMRYLGKVGELRRLLPIFNRRPGRLGEHEIVTMKAQEVVVGRVSRTYSLVQHHELLNALPHALRGHGYELDELEAELCLTLHGERMELVVYLPSHMATPPDGHALSCRLRCLNSVDCSTALEAELQWYRQVCSNGMFGWAGEPVRRAHRFADTLLWVQDRLYHRFQQLPDDRLHFARLMNIPVRWNDLQDWADVFVARKWGRREAARTLHICRNGKDAIVANAFDDQIAHELEAQPTHDVPGACAPVSSIYHVGQALSWVAGGADALQTKFSRTSAVPHLLRHLLN